MSTIEAPAAPLVETTPMDRPDWLEWRRHGIGGSDIAALLGLSRWASPWSLWAEKCGLIGDQPENDEMVGGRWLELAVGPWFTDRTGLHVAFPQARCVHPARSWQRCTIDGVAADTPNIDDITLALGVVEIKTGERGKDWDEIPAYYQAQAQWQMGTLDLERCWIPMLHGRRLTVYELGRDDADIEFMVAKAEAFWNDHVLTGVPPEVDGSDATLAALGEVWPEHVTDLGRDISHLRDVVEELAAAKEAKAEAEAREKLAKARIAEALEDAETGLIDGRPVLTFKAQDRTTIDTARLKAAHPDIAAEFSKTTTSRVLRPKKAA